MQPAGEYLGEEFHRAGGVPAVIKELIKAGRFHTDVLTVTGKTMGENHEAVPFSPDRRVIRPSRTRSSRTPASSSSAATSSIPPS